MSAKVASLTPSLLHAALIPLSVCHTSLHNQLLVHSIISLFTFVTICLFVRLFALVCFDSVAWFVFGLAWLVGICVLAHLLLSTSMCFCCFPVSAFAFGSDLALVLHACQYRLQ